MASKVTETYYVDFSFKPQEAYLVNSRSIKSSVGTYFKGSIYPLSNNDDFKKATQNKQKSPLQNVNTSGFIDIEYNQHMKDMLNRMEYRIYYFYNNQSNGMYKISSMLPFTLNNRNSATDVLTPYEYSYATNNTISNDHSMKNICTVNLNYGDSIYIKVINKERKVNISDVVIEKINGGECIDVMDATKLGLPTYFDTTYRKSNTIHLDSGIDYSVTTSRAALLSNSTGSYLVLSGLNTYATGASLEFNFDCPISKFFINMTYWSTEDYQSYLEYVPLGFTFEIKDASGNWGIYKNVSPINVTSYDFNFKDAVLDDVFGVRFSIKTTYTYGIYDMGKICIEEVSFAHDSVY